MKQLFSQNGLLKLLSIALALLLWMFVSTDADDMATREISRRYDGIQPSVRNQDPDLILVGDPQTVSASLRGTRTMLNRVEKDELVFYVDLEGLEAGTHRVPVSSSVPQFDVTDIQPSEVEITLDERIEETFAVDHDVIGTPDEGLQALEPEINPSTVTISGAKTYIEQVERVVARVDITGTVDYLEKGIVVDIYDENGEIMEELEVSPGMVEVKIPMNYPEKEVPVEVDIEDNLPEFYLESVEISPEQVEVGGWESVINELEYIKTETIGLDRFLEEETVVASLERPEGIKEISDQNVIVEGQISQTQEESFEIPVDLPEELANELANSQWEIEPEIITVSVAGEPEDMTALDKNDIEVYLTMDDVPEEDLETVEESEAVEELVEELDVEVQLQNDNLRLVKVDPLKVNLIKGEE
ncbi:CdaR family protein [Natranaerobius thermophilus]|uniref:YbbR family protein n=1 Tax=Natranaerobius thermophilus (strain ATCC BAA-1301 / DSM 18059 / JW/NM-WN-LF) TaxID=457570 RepID=B2A4R8_NATTJ|nr:CdaR family protein [Natranaerobius thermophilus]ACB83840.1 YbbR family protein [Natranaerobius thermophilus JW/NM-WN-LF]